MRSLSLSFAATWLLIQSCLAAVYQDDAFKTDFSLSLLGLPLSSTSFFHQPFAGSKASLIYTLSERNVLGAVNPKDGTIVWRQQLGNAGNSSTAHLRSGQGQDVVVSALGDEVSAWGAGDGRLVWTLNLEGELVKDLEVLELESAQAGVTSKDAFVLSGDQHPQLRRIDGSTGQVKWQFSDESGDAPHQLSASATEVFYITLHTTMLGGHKIKVISLDAISGKKTNEYSLSSESEVASASDILSVGANTASPVIAWTDKAATVLKVNVIGSKTIASFPIDKVSGQTIQKITLHAPYHTHARPHFLVHYQTTLRDWAEVYHVDLKTSSVSKAYSLPKLADKSAFSTSSIDANVYFSRVTGDEVSVVSSASHGVLARYPVSSFGVVAKDVYPVHAISELSVKGDTVSASRTTVLLSSGDWVLVRDDTVSWQRPEALAHTVAAVWAYPEANAHAVEELEKEAHASLGSAYVHRVKRHIADLQLLPAFLQSIPTAVLSSLGITTSTEEASSLAYNKFGYHKLIVCATDSGRLIALDVGNQGQVMWNKPVPSLGAVGHVESPLLYATPDGNIYYQSQKQSEQEKSAGAILHASTGELAEGDLVIPQAEVQYSFSETPLGLELQGRSQSGTAPLWRFHSSGGESIISVKARPVGEPIASIGKVLGDRSVLYKYLNPNTLMVTTASEKARTLSVYIIDAASGSVLYSTKHDNVDLSAPFASAVSENWFAYTITVDTTGSDSKGYQLVIGEMFESPLPNDRGPARNASDDALDYQPYVAMQTYIIPEPISHMSISQTAQGITSKELLVVLPESNAIMGIPRGVLDARRPVGRDPSKDEQFEGLMKYTPQLDFDSRWYLTHQIEMIGISNITTSPALLESTSLVFAYGLDVFGTRISPSFSFDVLGKDFNKIQMLATVFVLFIGTLVVAPIVARKQVNGRWQL